MMNSQMIDNAENRRLITFFHRYIFLNFPKDGMQAAFFVVNSEGQILDYDGNSELIQSLKMSGIDVGCSFNKNFHDEKQERYRSYYAPIKLNSKNSLPRPYKKDMLAGVYMVDGKREYDSGSRMIVDGMAHAIMMTIQFNNISVTGYEATHCGVISVDLLMNSEKRIINYCNEKAFDLLETDPFDINYKETSVLIDPLPSNRDFWEIVENMETVEEQYIDIEVHGKMHSLVASTTVFDQPSIRTKSVVFYFSKPSTVSKRIAKKVSNGAMLTFDDIIGDSPQIRNAVRKGKLFAGTDTNIMILGESGTGKDIMAQAIHNAGERRNKPFIAINCAAIPHDLVESELFGYTEGAFTGAKKSGNIGKLELANGGTVFFDEVGELPLEVQAKLLRAVEQKSFSPLGSSKTVESDFRIIAATNENIRDMVEKKQFRSDLYYRLCAATIKLPPLRERDSDVVPIAESIIRKLELKLGMSREIRLSPEAKELLAELRWPGNVRELQNVISCVMQIYDDEVITREHILDNLMDVPEEFLQKYPEGDQIKENSVTDTDRELKHMNARITEEEIKKALTACRWNKTDAAELLGISRKTLYRYMEHYNMN